MIPECKIKDGQIVEKYLYAQPYTALNGDQRPAAALTDFTPAQLKADGIYPLVVAGPPPKYFTRTVTDSFDGTQGIETPIDTPIPAAEKRKQQGAENKNARELAKGDFTDRIERLESIISAIADTTKLSKKDKDHLKKLSDAKVAHPEGND